MRRHHLLIARVAGILRVLAALVLVGRSNGGDDGGQDTGGPVLTSVRG
jgi:hypothetical protein